MPSSPPLSAATASKSRGINRVPIEPVWLRWLEAHPIRVLAFATLACLLPLVAKPFHIDDPMYLWAAEQIRHYPLDFYGFEVVWTGHRGPMSMVMQNPPLASYVIAGVSLVAGFSEVAMHLAFVIPAALLVIGTYQLARQFCRKPALAGLLTIATPVFIVCASTVTNDILMACCWVWAVYWWERGLRSDRWGPMVLSAALISLGCMTKYPAMNVIPLLMAYTILRRAPLKYLLALLIPVMIMVMYEQYTKHLYGRGLLTESMVYSAANRGERGFEPMTQTFVCICFIGGCLVPALLLSPALWRIRGVLLGVGLLVAATVILAMLKQDAILQLNVYGDYPKEFVFQIATWFVAGVGVLALTAADVHKRRDANAAMLGLWILGTFVFAGIVNWSVNGRTILPMVPAAAIVLVRRLDDFNTWQIRWRTVVVSVATAASLVLSMWVALADQCLAQVTRKAVERIMAKYGGQGSTTWFQGNWGLQYYMQIRGGQPWVPSAGSMKVNDLMVVPQFSSNTILIREPLASRVELVIEGSSVGLSTMNIAMGAAFYSHIMGPLPFVFGEVPVERYLVLRINVPYEPKVEATSKPED